MRVRRIVLTAALGVALVAGARATSAPPALRRADVRWLSRVTFGIDAATVSRFGDLGRTRFLDEKVVFAYEHKNVGSLLWLELFEL